jgi:DNA-binding IclR family transcriptional regulator
MSSLQKSLDIFACLAAKQRALTAKEIAEMVRVPNSTVYRYLHTLVDNGYLVRNRRDGSYQLGFMLLRLGNLVAEKTDFIDLIKPYTDQLFSACDETTMLMVRSGWNAVCVASRESSKLMRVSVRIGLVLPLHAGASGKMLLAYERPSFVDKYFRDNHFVQLTPYTVTDKTKLRKELERIHKQGYVVSDQEVNIGVAGISAPVLDSARNLVGAFLVAGPSDRIIPKTSNIVENVTHMALVASRSLGFLGD